VRWLDKGENIFTEMYSALRAEVPTEDPRTHLNRDAIARASSSFLVSALLYLPQNAVLYATGVIVGSALWFLNAKSCLCTSGDMF
jgi:hypothetical protein